MKLRTVILTEALTHLATADDVLNNDDYKLTEFSCNAITRSTEFDNTDLSAARAFYRDAVLDGFHNTETGKWERGYDWWQRYVDEPTQEIQDERFTALCFAIAMSETEE